MKAAYKTILWVLFLLFFHSFQTHAQVEKLFGYVDGNLIEIDPQTGDLTQFEITPGAPNNLYNLAYSPTDCIFYGIINHSASPSLISIDWEGNYNIIGTFSISGGNVYLAEALAYNLVDNKLYAAVSLNGGIPNNDYSSETIVEVNPSTAEVTIKTLIESSGSLEGDFDDMVFVGNTLIGHDGVPGSNDSDFYSIDFQGLGASIFPDLVFSTIYYPNRDMASRGNDVFFTTADLEFYSFNISNPSLNFIGPTPTSPTYSGEPIGGIEFVEIPVFEMNVDTLLCEGEELELSINGSMTAWNTGQLGNTLTINSPGEYWASTFIGGCPFQTDTAIVNFQNCDTCDIIYNQIAPDLIFGNDTTLCDFETLELTLNLSIPATINWNNSLSGNTIIINQTGTYWATIEYGDCVFQSDSIYVEMIPCDTCEFAAIQIVEFLDLREDTIICEGDSVELSIDLQDPYSIYWNTGQEGQSIFAQQPGTYWANILIDNCVIPTDTFNLITEDCSPCQYYIPNAFSPQGDGHNDKFQLYFNESLCEIISIEMSIFDRWGGLIIQTNKNEWDGYFNGKPMNTGVYVYMIKISVNQNGNIVEYFEAGDVTLVK